MRRLISTLVFCVLALQGFAQPDSLSRDSLLQVIAELQRREAAAPAVPIYSDAERFADSVRLSMQTGGGDYERQKAEADRMWPWALRIILLGAGVFILWAVLYKKRYRELHTRNGVYFGVGSKYFHDHYEQHHYDGSRWGASAGEDPWCYTERNVRQEPLPPSVKPSQGGGSSGTWQ